MTRPAPSRHRRATAALVAGLAVTGAAFGARAADIVAPPAMPAPDAWVGRTQATVRVLDKLDAGTAVLTLMPGEVAHFKSLSIKLGRCLSRPDGLSPDATAWLEIDDQRPDTPGFANWLFVAEPSLVMFQNPVYGVTLIGCAGGQTDGSKGHGFQPPPPPPDAPPNAPPDQGALPVSPGGAPPGDAVPGIPDPNAPDPNAPDATPPQTMPPGPTPAQPGQQ